jgi:hypothetical protein
MATYYSDQYNSQKPDRVRTGLQAPPNVSDGSVQLAVIPYTAVGTEAAGELIYLCQLPIGAIPIPALGGVYVPTDNITHTTFTVDIGTADNADGWADGIDYKAAGLTTFLSGTAPAYATTATSLTADSGAEDGLVSIYATVATASGGAITAGTWYFLLAYKLPR